MKEIRKLRKQLQKRILAAVLAIVLLAPAVSVVVTTNSSAEDKKVVSVLADSIGFGYGQLGYNGEYDLVQNNYYKSPKTAYPELFGAAIGTDVVYNLGVEGFKSSDCVNTLINPTWISEFVIALDYAANEAAGLPMQPLSYYQYHYLFNTVLKESDIITVQYGGNDIMQDFIAYIAAKAYNEDGSINNTALVALLDLVNGAVADGLQSGETTSSVSDTLLEKYFSDAEHIADVLKIVKAFADGTVQQALNAIATSVAENYKKIYDIIKNGIVLTEEEYNLILACYAEADVLAETASDEAPAENAFSEKEILLDGRATVTVLEDGTYFMEPLNPDADVIFVDLYNPFTDGGEPLSAEDEAEVKQYFMSIFNVIGKFFQGPEELKDIPTPMEVYSATKNYQNIWRGFYHSYYPKCKDMFLDYRYLNRLTVHWKEARKETYEAVKDSWLAGLESELSDAVGNMPFGMIYYLIGSPMQPTIDFYDEAVKEAAEEKSAIYVSVHGMKSARWSDVHPNAEGHAYIAVLMTEAYLSAKGLVTSPNPEDEQILTAAPLMVKSVAYSAGNDSENPAEESDGNVPVLLSSNTVSTGENETVEGESGSENETVEGESGSENETVEGEAESGNETEEGENESALSGEKSAADKEAAYAAFEAENCSCKTNNTKVILSIILLVLTLVACGLALFFTFHDSKKKK